MGQKGTVNGTCEIHNAELADRGSLGGGVVGLHHDGEDGVRAAALRVHLSGSRVAL